MSDRKEAGLGDMARAAGRGLVRGVGHAAPFAGLGLGIAGGVLGASSLGLPALGAALPEGGKILGFLGQAVRGAAPGAGAMAGSLLGRAAGSALLKRPAPGPGPGVSAAAGGASGAFLTPEHIQRLHDHVTQLRDSFAAHAAKTAAVRDNAYYAGAAHAGQVFHALTQLGVRPRDLKRVRNILHRSAAATSLSSEETPHGTPNFRRGVTAAMKSFHRAAKDLESFRQQGGPQTARVEHDLASDKIRYYQPDAADGTRHREHFAVRRPGALWGSKLETYDMPKAASDRLPYLVASMKLAEMTTPHGGMPAINLKKLEQHANEHRLMRILNIGLRGHPTAMEA